MVVIVGMLIVVCVLVTIVEAENQPKVCIILSSVPDCEKAPRQSLRALASLTSPNAVPSVRRLVPCNRAQRHMARNLPQPAPVRVQSVRNGTGFRGRPGLHHREGAATDDLATPQAATTRANTARRWVAKPQLSGMHSRSHRANFPLLFFHCI